MSLTQRRTRICFGLAIVVLAVAIAALTRWSGDGGTSPSTTTTSATAIAGTAAAVGAEGGDAAGAVPDPLSNGDAGVAADEAGASSTAVIAADPGDDAAHEVHPASAAQTTLQAAAGQAAGPGVVGPAAEVSGGDQTEPPVDPDDVLSATAARGGCMLDYGDPGQCLPTRPPSSSAQAVWTCADVWQLFPDGLTARAGDALRLDGNGDGLACGPGD